MNQARYESLERQHFDIDVQILKETKRPQPNQDVIHQLKKRKLKLKEEISNLVTN